MENREWIPGSDQDFDKVGSWMSVFPGMHQTATYGTIPSEKSRN